MSTIYLVRHGQAGTRDAYDSLSELGIRQAQLLGEYFVSQRIAFHEVISGSLNRQRQTAESAAAGCAISIDPAWDEFDLTRVYREIAPQLCAEDEEFSRQHAEMKRQIRDSAGAADARVHREWQPCDSKVVRAWVSGRYRQEGEIWEQFQRRIADCLERLRDLPDDAHVAIFTSATPIGIWCGLALDIFDERSIRLAGVVHNSSYTVFRLREKQLRLFSFNATPHLNEASLRTHR